MTQSIREIKQDIERLCSLITRHAPQVEEITIQGSLPMHDDVEFIVPTTDGIEVVEYPSFTALVKSEITARNAK